MKAPEDEAFDELAKRQGAWGGGFKAKQAMAADKMQEPPSEWAGIKAILDEYGLQAIDFVADFKAALAQPVQEPYDQTALELCQVCGWKTLIPTEGCLNCERKVPLPAQEPVCDKDPQGCWNVRCQLGKQCKNLAQPAQDPVAHVYLFDHKGRPRIAWDKTKGIKIGDKLYTAPPQRPWVGLTEEDFSAINQSCLTKLQAATSAESILKERNHGT